MASPTPMVFPRARLLSIPGCLCLPYPFVPDPVPNPDPAEARAPVGLPLPCHYVGAGFMLARGRT